MKTECKGNDWLRFDIPEGETCGSYMRTFFENGGSGYVEDENNTQECGYCKYSSGSDYYTPLTWDVDNRYFLFLFLAFIKHCFSICYSFSSCY